MPMKVEWKDNFSRTQILMKFWDLKLQQIVGLLASVHARTFCIIAYHSITWTIFLIQYRIDYEMHLLLIKFISFEHKNDMKRPISVIPLTTEFNSTSEMRKRRVFFYDQVISQVTYWDWRRTDWRGGCWWYDINLLIKGNSAYSNIQHNTIDTISRGLEVLPKL